MRKTLLIMVICLMFISINLIAQNIAIGFKDKTLATKTLVNKEFGVSKKYPNGYPFPTFAKDFDRWVIQFYKDGGDNIISTPDSLGNPCGDDSIAIGIANTTQGLTLAPTGILQMNAVTFMALGQFGNTGPGDKIFIRIFNSPKIETATKYIQFDKLYQITADRLQTANIVPDYGWSDWISISR